MHGALSVERLQSQETDSSYYSSRLVGGGSVHSDARAAKLSAAAEIGLQYVSIPRLPGNTHGCVLEYMSMCTGVY